tara:strand:- start:282 stop:503 length:222 start_codon:yes stop_codon:yes gene_type:complete
MKKKKSKTATIVATYRTDLELIIGWLRLNKAISGSSVIRKLNSTYATTVRAKSSKADINKLVKDRFGVFAKVV